MGQASNVRGFRRAQLAAAVTLAVLGSTAVAADPATNNGAMQFPNVHVINMPEAAQPALSAPQGGMRAYKDSPTGALRGPTSEEMQTASRSMATSARRAATTDDQSSSDAPSFAAAGGGVGVMLDDSSLQYSVVVRQADGSLKEICVTGAEQADAVVRTQAVSNTAAQQEIKNDR